MAMSQTSLMAYQDRLKAQMCCKPIGFEIIFGWSSCIKFDEEINQYCRLVSQVKYIHLTMVLQSSSIGDSWWRNICFWAHQKWNSVPFRCNRKYKPIPSVPFLDLYCLHCVGSGAPSIIERYLWSEDSQRMYIWQQRYWGIDSLQT